MGMQAMGDDMAANESRTDAKWKSQSYMNQRAEAASAERVSGAKTKTGTTSVRRVEETADIGKQTGDGGIVLTGGCAPIAGGCMAMGIPLVLPLIPPTQPNGVRDITQPSPLSDAGGEAVDAIGDWLKGGWEGFKNVANMAAEMEYGTKIFNDAEEDLEGAREPSAPNSGSNGETSRPRGLPPEGISPPVPGTTPGPASRPSERDKGGQSLWDPDGGEWRYSPEDRWHNPHWDHNPHDRPQSPWQNIPIGDLPPRK